MGLFTRNAPEATAAAPSKGQAKPEAPANAAASAQAPAARPSSLAPHASHTEQSPQLNERQRYLLELKSKIHTQLIDRLDVQNLRVLPPETVRVEVRSLVSEMCQSEKVLLTSLEQDKLMDDVMD